MKYEPNNNKFIDENGNIQYAYSDIFQQGNSWLRHKSYKIEEINNQLYICPATANYEFYNPWDSPVEILKVFMDSLNKINPYYLKLESQKTKKLKKLNILNDIASILLGFINRYGLMGLFRDRARYFDYRKFINNTPLWSDHVQTVILKDDKYRGSFVSLKDPIPNTLSLSYSDYASYFFPKLEGNYPAHNVHNAFNMEQLEFGKIVDNGRIYQEIKPAIPTPYSEMIRFINNYCENVESIIVNNRFRAILDHITATKESILDSSVIIPEISIDVTSLKYSNRKMSWNISSLIEGVSIIYILNLNNQLGQKLFVCGKKTCNTTFIQEKESQKYCSPKCRRAAEQYRARKRK